MILVANCFNEKAFAVDFDRAVARRFEGTSARCDWTEASQLASIADASRHTHLLISGSVASAMDDQPWDGPLTRLVHQFMEAGKPVLGICYGHQFLAKALAGPGHVRKAARPEFGFRRLRLTPTALFDGLPETFAMVSHFDEVFDLPADFKVLAASDDCAVHAFQYRDQAVWGVQFHPEYDPEDGDRIWKVVFRDTPELLPPAPERPEETQQNRQIFTNFLALGQ